MTECFCNVMPCAHYPNGSFTGPTPPRRVKKIQLVYRGTTSHTEPVELVRETAEHWVVRMTVKGKTVEAYYRKEKWERWEVVL